MAGLIVLRLHPVEPDDAATFTRFLKGLSMKAFDLTFRDSITGVPIGEARGEANSHSVSTTNNSANISNTSILKRHIDIPIPRDSPPLNIGVFEPH